MLRRFFALSLPLFVLLFALGCRDEAATTTSASSSAAPITLDVYKSPTCGCCADWITHTEANGFSATIHHPEDLNAVKQRFGIAPKYQSCHTGVSSDGFVFEGHIPARLIKKFLAEKPTGAIGLAVPGMPIGSPGMEMGERVTPYDVLQLNKDGSTSVYSHVSTLEK
ncbi:MAG TPA: DUF411 domain-containing protein [Cellvibrio sp.]|nr:DUF411 domain-containing protein [Cellvibrio sp.]